MDLTASQARKIALSRKGRVNIDDVMSHIQMSMNSSKLQCTYYKTLTEIQKKRLEDLGFRLEEIIFDESREIVIRYDIFW